MARLCSIGFELLTTTPGFEMNSTFGTTGISTTTKRTGAASLQIGSMASGTAEGHQKDIAGSALNGPYYWRVYLNVATFPSAENCIILINDGGGVISTPVAYITIDNGGLLRLYDEDGQIGLASSALATGTWYRIEGLLDRTAAAGSHVISARIDGTDFAASNARNLSAGFRSITLGGNLLSEAQTTGSWFFDDFAVNDNTGSAQNSYPGPGSIIYLFPDGAGDNTDWTPLAGANWAAIDDVAPDNDTTYVETGTLNHTDLYNVQDSTAIGGTDVINVVQVNVRFRNDVNDATTALAALLKKSGGSTSQSAAVTRNNTGYTVNNSLPPRNPMLTLHTDPDSAAWSKATIDAMQIGIKLTTANVNKIRVTQVYATVDFSPGGTPGSANVDGKFFELM